MNFKLLKEKEVDQRQLLLFLCIVFIIQPVDQMEYQKPLVL
jgi:hypothetical protein